MAAKSSEIQAQSFAIAVVAMFSLLVGLFFGRWAFGTNVNAVLEIQRKAANESAAIGAARYAAGETTLGVQGNQIVTNVVTPQELLLAINNVSKSVENVRAMTDNLRVALENAQSRLATIENFGQQLDVINQGANRANATLDNLNETMNRAALQVSRIENLLNDVNNNR